MTLNDKLTSKDPVIIGVTSDPGAKTLIMAIKELNAVNIAPYLIDEPVNLRKLPSNLDLNVKICPVANVSDFDSLLANVIECQSPCVLSLTESKIIKAAQVRERLGLVGNSLAVEKIIVDKLRTRRSLEQAHLTKTKFRYCSTRDLKDKVLEVGFPAIVKPRDLAASIGVERIEKFDFERRIAKTIEYLNDHPMIDSENLIVESFIPGKEFSVEGIVIDGQLNVYCVTEKRTTGAPYFVEEGHTVPAHVPDQEGIQQYLQNVVRAIGYSTAPLHAEIKIDSDGSIDLIETHSRFGGDRIISLVVNSFGYRPFTDIVQALFGQINSIKRVEHKCLTSIEFFEETWYSEFTSDCLEARVRNALDKKVLEFEHYDQMDFPSLPLAERQEIEFNRVNRAGHVIFESRSYEERDYHLRTLRDLEPRA